MKETSMIGKLLQKVSNKYDDWRIQDAAKKFFERAKWELDDLNEEGGDVRLASDLHWLAIYTAEKSENKNLVSKLKEEAFFCNGYDPFKSRMTQIREIAYNKKKREEALTLEMMAEDRMKLGIKEAVDLAIEYHTSALEAAKSIKDPKLVEEIKTCFKDASKNYGK